MQKTKRLLSMILALALVFSLSGTGLGSEAQSGDIIILTTNDVHNGVDRLIDSNGNITNMGYAGLASYAVEMKALVGENNVTLVDAGDSIQGEAIGTLSKGEYLIEIMDFVGYDVAVPGNHEFDYGIDRFLELAEKASFSYVSSNFIGLETGKTLLDAYTILTYGGVKVAYVGISTPETFTKSNPTYFQDENGNYIYGFCEGNNGNDLYDAVQATVDAARAEGADYVIAVGHLGTEDGSSPWTSKEVIGNTTGIDAFADGHSHSTINGENVQNKFGEDVVLVQAGTKLSSIGKIVIKADGTITGETVSGHTGIDAATNEFVKSIQAFYGDELNRVVATTEVGLFVNDPETGKRKIRNSETNLGDLCADAYRTLLSADIAFVNGGGIRADIKAGDITYGDIIDVHPYGNSLCLIETTGQQILNALEHGSRFNPSESGGFLQVSGITYTIDTTIESSVLTDDKNNFVEVTGERRIKDVKVGGIDIDPEMTYTLASHDYMLKSSGDGFSMFKGDTLLQDEVLLDYQALINYIVDELGGIVGEEYSNPYGQGRITIVTSSSTTDISSPFTDVKSTDWFYNEVLEAYGLGLVKGVNETTFDPNSSLNRSMVTTILYRMEGEPEVEFSKVFPDVADGLWYSDAVVWASESGLVEGYNDGTFAPDKPITRQEMGTILYRYAKDYKGYEIDSDENALDSFKDVDKISDYAYDAIEWAVTIGILKGNAGNIDPLGTTTRAQGTALLLQITKIEFEVAASAAA